MKNLIAPAIIVLVGYFLLMQSKPVDPVEARRKLLDWANEGGDSEKTKDIFRNRMTDAEILVTYDFVFNYVLTGKKVEVHSPMYYKIDAISVKYNIFT